MVLRQVSHLGDEWSCAGMRPGAPSVMIHGQPTMAMSPAGSWDSPDMVCFMPDSFTVSEDEVGISTAIAYPSGAVVYPNAFFGMGTGRILLNDVRCTGSETRLVDCPSGGVGNSNNCRGHTDDAGVQCQPRKCTRLVTFTKLVFSQLLYFVLLDSAPFHA